MGLVIDHKTDPELSADVKVLFKTFDRLLMSSVEQQARYGEVAEESPEHNEVCKDNKDNPTDATEKKMPKDAESDFFPSVHLQTETDISSGDREPNIESKQEPQMLHETGKESRYNVCIGYDAANIKVTNSVSKSDHSENDSLTNPSSGELVTDKSRVVKISEMKLFQVTIVKAKIQAPWTLQQYLSMTLIAPSVLKILWKK
jgi:hypothetical protein